MCVRACVCVLNFYLGSIKKHRFYWIDRLPKATFRVVWWFRVVIKLYKCHQWHLQGSQMIWHANSPAPITANFTAPFDQRIWTSPSGTRRWQGDSETSNTVFWTPHCTHSSSHRWQSPDSISTGSSNFDPSTLRRQYHSNSSLPLSIRLLPTLQCYQKQRR